MGFSFATVYGAGHMVPETRPEAASALFARFLASDSSLRTGLAQMPLAIAKQPESVVVRPDEAFSLEVELTGGHGPFRVSWTQDSRPLSATWQQAALNLDANETNGERLHVKNAAPCHEGRYVCTASDMDGSTVTCGAVTVTLVAAPEEDPTACATAACAAAAVESLPGWHGPLPSRHYSGYVDVSAEPGTTPGRFLHYWLVEAEDVDPATAPLVLWLNGGPGCSSMEGLMSEVGPLFLDKADPTTLRRNPHTWARTANVLFLESPIGVGFSYTEEGTFGSGVHVNDTATAVDAEVFLRRFLTAPALFPELRPNPLHIAGESYAGIYIPTLADEIVRGNDAGATPLNLRGLLIGNGCTGSDTPSCGQPPSASTFLESSSGHQLAFLHDHAMISDRAFAAATAACDTDRLGQIMSRDSCRQEVSEPPAEVAEECFRRGEGDFVCPLTNSSSPVYGCCESLGAAMGAIGTVNVYGLYERCDQPSSGSGPPSWFLPQPDDGADTPLRGLDGCWGR